MPSSYIVEKYVCYLAICDKTYPRRLAFSYLEDLQKDFDLNYGQELKKTLRPYAFVKFGIFYCFYIYIASSYCKDSTIQQIKKQYKNTQTQRNIAKLNEDLHDVTRIMTKNIQDVLGRQDALNSMVSVFNVTVDL